MTPLPSPTERLWFRRWTEDDLERARGLWGDPRVTARIARGPLDEAAIRERLAAEIACERAHGVQYWPIFLRSTGAHAGCCGLRPRDGAPDAGGRVFELGFHLRADHWGLGLATEAARATLDLAFGPLGAAALFAGHHPENDGSRRTLEKLGFRRSGVERYPATGLLHPSYWLAAGG
ncbi:MAG: GNAT family N-acetyltransferase [Nannocystaceae bacterium]